jgi:hypothetical protein
MKTQILSLGLLLCASVASAHPGGVDSYGGHLNKLLNTYECHKCDGAFQGRTYPSKAAYLLELTGTTPPTDPAPPPPIVCPITTPSDWELKKAEGPLFAYDIYVKGIKIPGQGRGMKFIPTSVAGQVHIYVMGIEDVETWYWYDMTKPEWPWVPVP